LEQSFTARMPLAHSNYGEDACVNRVSYTSPYVRTVAHLPNTQTVLKTKPPASIFANVRRFGMHVFPRCDLLSSQ